MADRWMIRGTEFANCNCAWGCPCHFGALTTHGLRVDPVRTYRRRLLKETRLDGLNWSLLVYWPGEIAQGNGQERAIIDERADADQREAPRKILHGESTTPGATHFFAYNSVVSTVHDPIYAPIDLSIHPPLRPRSRRPRQPRRLRGRHVLQ